MVNCLTTGNTLPGKRRTMAATSIAKLAMVAAFAITCTGWASAAVVPSTNICTMLPAKSSAVIIFRNPAALDRKIVQMERDLKIPMQQDPLQSTENSMNLIGNIKEDQPAAVVMLDRPKGSIEPASQWAVVAVAVKNYAAMQKNYQCGTAQDGINSGQDPSGNPIFIAQENGYALLSPVKQALQAFIANKQMLSSTLSPTYSRAIEKNDVSAYLNMSILGPGAKAELDAYFQMMLGFEASDPSQADALVTQLGFERLIGQFLTNSRRQFIGIHITNRGITLQNSGDMKPGTPMGQLVAAQPTLEASPLGGLPNGRYVAATAAVFNGLAFSQWFTTLEKSGQQNGITASVEKKLDSAITQYQGMIANESGSRAVVLSSRRGHGLSVVELGTYADAAKGLKTAEAMIPAMMKKMQSTGPVPFKIVVTPNAVNTNGVSLTQIHMSANGANAASVASVFKMIFGSPALVEYAGATNNHNIIVAANVHKSGMASLIATSRANVDNLSKRESIRDVQSHVLPHANFVMYILINRMLSDVAGNLRKANGLPQPTTKGLVLGRRFLPMVVSTSARGNRISAKIFIPMATLEDTINQGRAIVPLFALMAQ